MQMSGNIPENKVHVLLDTQENRIIGIFYSRDAAIQRINQIKLDELDKIDKSIESIKWQIDNPPKDPRLDAQALETPMEGEEAREYARRLYFYDTHRDVLPWALKEELNYLMASRELVEGQIRNTDPNNLGSFSIVEYVIIQ